MTARATLEALADLGVDVSRITTADLAGPPPRPVRCAACPRMVDVLVSTTGTRWVCLTCAETITRAAEQRREAS